MSNTIDELRQEITDICFELGEVTLPLVDALEALIHRTQLESRLNELDSTFDKWNNTTNTGFAIYYEKREAELQAALEKQA